jgi:hypothetical protein
MAGFGDLFKNPSGLLILAAIMVALYYFLYPGQFITLPSKDSTPMVVTLTHGAVTAAAIIAAIVLVGDMSPGTIAVKVG